MQPSPLLTLGLTALLLTVSGTARAADQFAGKAYYYGDPHAHTGLSHDGWSSDLGDGCPPEGECGAFADAFQIATDNGWDPSLADSAADLDMDGDGETDAISVGFTFEAPTCTLF